MVRLLPALVPLGIARSAIATHEELYNQAHGEVKRVLAEMAKFNEAATVNNQVFSALQRSFSGFQQQADEQAAERARAWQEFNSLTFKFAEKLVQEQSALLKMQIPLLVAIRSDLGLGIDLSAFERQITEQWSQLTTEMQRSLVRMKEANPSIERTA